MISSQSKGKEHVPMDSNEQIKKKKKKKRSIKLHLESVSNWPFDEGKVTIPWSMRFWMACLRLIHLSVR